MRWCILKRIVSSAEVFSWNFFSPPSVISFRPAGGSNAPAPARSPSRPQAPGNSVTSSSTASSTPASDQGYSLSLSHCASQTTVTDTAAGFRHPRERGIFLGVSMDRRMRDTFFPVVGEGLKPATLQGARRLVGVCRRACGAP